MSSKNTHTVRLRALEPEDLELIYLLENECNDPTVAATSVPVSHYVVKQYLETTSHDLFVDGALRLVIENNDGVAVGTVDLTDFNPQHSRAEIGLTILQAHQGKHYGRMAMEAVEEYAHRHCIHQLYCIISNQNEGAQRLFHLLKYNVTATLPDWLQTPEGYISATLFSKILG